MRLLLAVTAMALVCGCGGPPAEDAAQARTDALTQCVQAGVCPGAAMEGVFYGCISQKPTDHFYDWYPATGTPPCRSFFEVYRCLCAGNERVFWWNWPPLPNQTCESMRADWTTQSASQCQG